MKFYLLLALGSVFLYANAQNEPVVIQPLQGEIILDGKVNEQAWRNIKPFPLISHWPEYGNQPTDHTEIRVTYDKKYIYICGIINIEADSMLVASFKRDIFTMGTDYLAIMLDTFNDNENALLFATTPTGTRTDAAFSEDGKNVDDSWDTFWDAEAVINPDGWSAEMRIPFASMGFQDIAGIVEMGLMVYMYSAKKYDMVMYPAIEPNWGFWSWAKSTQFQKVTFKNIESHNPVYITPYILGGFSIDKSEFNSDSSAYLKKDDITRNIGLDVRYNVTDNLTLDFSLNTDFAQVEADDQQVNLTRFSLFFPEKRRFFLERASIFDFSFSGTNRLFYTRNIGINEDGENVDVLGGARLSGRVGGWDVGLLNVQTVKHKDSQAENFGVIRLKKQVVNPFSYMGGMITNRVNQNGSFNLAVGLDGLINIYDNDFFYYSIAQTHTDSTDKKVDFSKASRFRIRWERRSYTGFAYDITVERTGKKYNPAMGFEQREDNSHLYAGISYGWAEKGHPYFQSHRFAIMSDFYTRNKDNSIETIEIRPFWEATLVSGLSMEYGLFIVHEDLKEGFDINDDVVVENGKYDFVQAFSTINTSGGRVLSADNFISFGTFYDGYIFTLRTIPKWIVSKYVELSATYEYNNINFESRDQLLKTHISRLKALFTFNTKLSFSSFIQYNSTADIIFSNARFRYNPNEGHDLYIVYNELFNSDRRSYNPVRALVRNRTILAKYTYTLTY